MSYDRTSLNQFYHDHQAMPESPLPKKLSSSPTTHHRASSDMSPNTQSDHEKRARREIANSNERRRMQSINTGFQSLKILIPHSCGEKLSKACILQRAADHIKTLETEKLKLQSQNEQFRILIKSFQIDSSSVLQAQRRLSTNDPDQTAAVLLLSNPHEKVNPTYEENKSTNRTYWHAQYVQSTNDDSSSPTVEKVYRTVQQTSPTTTSDTTYMIVKQNPPSQRCYKTNSLDQTNDNNNVVLIERCQLRTQSVDTPQTGSRPNLQTIVEAIRHLEGDDALSNISPPSSQRPQEELPAQIKALIHEKFPQTATKTFQNNFNPHEIQTGTTTTGSGHLLTHDIELHQRPPKKRKITFNENDETLIEKTDILPISSPDVHHHEQVSSEPSNMAGQLFHY